MRLDPADLRPFLLQHATLSPERVASFFKTGPGEYAHHDQFIGVPVPALRKVLPLLDHWDISQIKALLASPINEERLVALLLLVRRYRGASLESQQEIIRFYQHNLDQVNNWNLVDASAYQLLGAFLVTQQDRQVLLDLAESPCVWRRRIAIVATLALIKAGDLSWTLRLATLFFKDSHDLIHKATGWMLREAGKQDRNALQGFLNTHAPSMPRVMLRYAIEKLPNIARASYLSMKPQKVYH